MDAIQLIRRDHRNIDQLFNRFERADGDPAEQGRVARDIVRELSIHAAIEEQLLYPAMRRAGLQGDVFDALEEHHAVKLTLAEIDAAPATHPRFASKVKVLASSVRQHVEEEENDILPRLERALDAEALRKLGVALEGARRAAPTRPHPAAPDTPPGNFVANGFSAVMDRARDAMRGGLEMLRVVVRRGYEAGVGGAREAVRFGGERAREASEEVRDESRGRIAKLRGAGRAIAEDVGEGVEQGRRLLRASTRTAVRAVETQSDRAERGAEASRARASRRKASRAKASRTSRKRSGARRAAARRGGKARSASAQHDATMH